jgi:hypothetical protein
LAINQTYRGIETMKTLNMARAAVTALAGVAFASASLPAHAEIKN